MVIGNKGVRIGARYRGQKIEEVKYQKPKIKINIDKGGSGAHVVSEEGRGCMFAKKATSGGSEPQESFENSP